MLNVSNYWSILDSLRFPVIGVSGDAKLNNEDRLRMNTEIIQKSLQLTPAEVTEYLVQHLQLEHLQDELTRCITSANQQYLYTVYSLMVLQKICSNEAADFNSESKDGLVSERHKALIVSLIEDIVEYGLKPNLYPTFYGASKSVFSRSINMMKFDFHKTMLIVTAFSPLIHIQSLQSGNRLDETVLSYMAAVYSLLLAYDAKEHHLEQSQITALLMQLQSIWTGVSTKIYYRNLMLLYAILPATQKQRIHKDMLLKLWSSGGFVSLLFAMLESKGNEGKPVAEVVSNLVAQQSYSAKAQQSLVKQILQFLAACLSNKELMPHMGVGLLSLRKLYENNMENKSLIKNWLRQHLNDIIEIKENSLTVMDWLEFTGRISLLFHMFCTSTIECLPSELLTSYIPVLITCYQHIRRYGKHDIVSSHLSSLLLKIFNNRQNDELDSIIKSVALNSYPQTWLHLHPKISFEENALNAQELKIVQKEIDQDFCASFLTGHMYSIAVILKESSFNALSYQIFISLFRLLPSLGMGDTNSRDDTSTEKLLLTDEELQHKILRDISQRYHLNMCLIKSLEILLQHKPLVTLIQENIAQIAKVLQDILTVYSSTTNKQFDNEMKASVIMVLLALVREIVASCSPSKVEEIKMALNTPLMRLEAQTADKNLKYQIISLQKHLIGETLQHNDNYGSSEADFEEARCLMESNESYIQVEGIEKFIKLINANDTFTVNSVHIVTALALNSLKSTESYTFLNCVRLFAALVNVNAPEILDILADEYLNESAGTDYRLVVGEALVRVCKELGSLCYKYKALLLNTYMAGCRSPLDEFRYSSFSNLSQMCRILTYQIHNFFEELLNLINNELSTGKYLPAKRAAVMVLSDLLAGMDNLLDYQEMLLPIYRLLKYLASSETTDEKIRLHAAMGLEILAMKCKELLISISQQPLEKEIQIMGVGNKPKRSLKDHILYV